MSSNKSNRGTWPLPSRAQLISPPPLLPSLPASQPPNGLNLSNRDSHQTRATGALSGHHDLATDLSVMQQFVQMSPRRVTIFNEPSSRLCADNNSGWAGVWSSYDDDDDDDDTFPYYLRRRRSCPYGPSYYDSHQQPTYPPRSANVTESELTFDHPGLKHVFGNDSGSRYETGLPGPTSNGRSRLPRHDGWGDLFRPNKSSSFNATVASASGSTKAGTGSTRASYSESTSAKPIFFGIAQTILSDPPSTFSAPGLARVNSPTSRTVQFVPSGAGSESSRAPVSGSTQTPSGPDRHTTSRHGETTIKRPVKPKVSPSLTLTSATEIPPPPFSSTCTTQSKQTDGKATDEDICFIADLRRLLASYEAAKNYQTSSSCSYAFHLGVLHQAVDSFEADLHRAPAVHESYIEIYWTRFKLVLDQLVNQQVNSTPLQAATTVDELFHLIETIKRRISSTSPTEKSFFHEKMTSSIDLLVVSIAKLLKHCTGEWMRFVTEDAYLYSSLLEDGCEKFLISCCRLLRQIFIEEKLAVDLKLETLFKLLHSMMPFWLLQAESSHYDKLLDGIQYYAPMAELYDDLFDNGTRCKEQWLVKPAALAGALLGLANKLTEQSIESVSKQSYYTVMQLYKKMEPEKTGQAMLKNVWAKLGTVIEKIPLGVEAVKLEPELDVILFQLFKMFELYSGTETNVLIQDDVLRTNGVGIIECFLQFIVSECDSLIWNHFGLIDAEISRQERNPESLLMMAYLSSMGYDRENLSKPKQNATAIAVNELKPSTSAVKPEEVVFSMPKSAQVIIDLDSGDSESESTTVSVLSMESLTKQKSKKKPLFPKTAVNSFDLRCSELQPSSSFETSRKRSLVIDESSTCTTRARTDSTDLEPTTPAVVLSDSEFNQTGTSETPESNNEIVLQIMKIQRELLTHQEAITELMKKLTDTND